MPSEFASLSDARFFEMKFIARVYGQGGKLASLEMMTCPPLSFTPPFRDPRLDELNLLLMDFPNTLRLMFSSILIVMMSSLLITRQ